MPPADNSRYLTEASRRRHDQARDRAARAIDTAAGRGTAVTVSGIAAAAGVSRSWLYTQDDLRAAIAELMRRRPAPGRPAPPAAASDESLRRRLEASQASGKKLREDNADLRRRLEAAHGEIRRLRALAPNPGG
jgi:hypothetical protein